MEHLALDTGERKDRDVDRRNDEYPEKRRANHLLGRTEYDFQALGDRHQIAAGLTQASQAVLHDDHRAVDDQAKIERSQAHQVRTYAALHHAGDGHQHGDGDDRCGQQRRPDVAEKQEQHGNHQKGAFNEIGPYRYQGLVHQSRAVVYRCGGNPFRQTGLDLFQPCRRGLRDFTAVCADQHEHGAHDHFTAILGGRAIAQLLADPDPGDIGQANGNALGDLHHNKAQRLDVLRLTGHAHQPLGAVMFDEPRALIGIVLHKGIDDVFIGEPVDKHFGRERGDQDFLAESADRIYLDDSGHPQQLRADDPVVNRTEVGGRYRRTIGISGAGLSVHREHENLTQSGGHGPKSGFQSLWQSGLGGIQAFGHQLTRKVDVRVLVENHSNLRQAVTG